MSIKIKSFDLNFSFKLDGTLLPIFQIVLPCKVDDFMDVIIILYLFF